MLCPHLAGAYRYFLGQLDPTEVKVHVRPLMNKMFFDTNNRNPSRLSLAGREPHQKYSQQQSEKWGTWDCVSSSRGLLSPGRTDAPLPPTCNVSSLHAGLRLTPGHDRHSAPQTDDVNLKAFIVPCWTTLYINIDLFSRCGFAKTSFYLF